MVNMAAFAAGLDQILPAERVEDMLSAKDNSPTMGLGWQQIGGGAGHGGGGRDEQFISVWRPLQGNSAYAICMQGQPFENTLDAFHAMCGKYNSVVS
jgi:hypothetical protein